MNLEKGKMYKVNGHIYKAITDQNSNRVILVEVPDKKTHNKHIVIEEVKED